MDCDLEGPRGPSWRRAPALALSWATKCVRTLSLCPATGEVIPENEPGHQSDPPLARVSRPLPRCPLCRVRTVDPAGGDSLADSFPELWRRQEDPRAKPLPASSDRATVRDHKFDFCDARGAGRVDSSHHPISQSRWK